MATALLNILSLLVALMGSTAAAEARSADVAALAGSIAAEDGRVVLHYAAREGVRGNGDCLRIELNDDVTHTITKGYWSPEAEYGEGPVWVRMTVSEGEVRRLEIAVGRAEDVDHRAARDLGEVPSATAAAYFLDLVPHLKPSRAEDALMAAFVARDGRIEGRLLDFARDRTLDDDVRGGALVWAAHLAGAKLMDEAVDLIHESRESLELREHAVFALSQIDDARGTDHLMSIAREHPRPQLRRAALVFLAHGREDDPRVVELLESIILDE